MALLSASLLAANSLLVELTGMRIAVSMETAICATHTYTVSTALRPKGIGVRPPVSGAVGS
jgi:hypothetical protein